MQWESEGFYSVKLGTSHLLSAASQVVFAGRKIRLGHFFQNSLFFNDPARTGNLQNLFKELCTCFERWDPAVHSSSLGTKSTSYFSSPAPTPAESRGDELAGMK